MARPQIVPVVQKHKDREEGNPDHAIRVGKNACGS
jgi:hypothetical protein